MSTKSQRALYAALDNITKGSGRSLDELRRAAIERDQVMSATPGVRAHPLQSEDEATMDAIESCFKIRIQ